MESTVASSEDATYSVLYGILSLLVIESLFAIFMSFRQLKVCKSALEIPKELNDSMKKKTFEKARKYTIDMEVFDIFQSVVFMILSCLEIYSGFLAILWQWSVRIVESFGGSCENEIFVSSLFVFLISLASLIRETPFSIYETFVLEHEYGFNKQNFSFFIWDQIKCFLATQLIAIPVAALFIYIMQISGDDFVIWLWIFTIVISMVCIVVYPVAIAPLFDTYTPLGQGELRESIQKLADSVGFPLAQLYVVDGSKRSEHSNAYFYGFWKSKRIVLFDTLLSNYSKAKKKSLREEETDKGFTHDEIIAIIGHEMGHWKLNHFMKSTIVMHIYVLMMLVIFGFCFNYGPFYEAVGFEPGTAPVIIGMLVVFGYILSPLHTLLHFAMNMLSQRFEYQADEFAYKLGFGRSLQRALIKINVENLDFPIYDWLYSTLSHSHPTLLQRLNRLKELDVDSGLGIDEEDKKSQ